MPLKEIQDRVRPRLLGERDCRERGDPPAVVGKPVQEIDVSEDRIGGGGNAGKQGAAGRRGLRRV
jgi:hypothetical protein